MRILQRRKDFCSVVNNQHRSSSGKRNSNKDGAVFSMPLYRCGNSCIRDYDGGYSKTKEDFGEIRYGIEQNNGILRKKSE